MNLSSDGEEYCKHKSEWRNHKEETHSLKPSLKIYIQGDNIPHCKVTGKGKPRIIVAADMAKGK